MMRKLFFVSLAVCLLGAAWWSRYPLMFFVYSHYFRQPPEKIAFLEVRSGSVVVHYVRCPFLLSHADSIARNLNDNLVASEKELGTKLDSDLNIYLYNNWEQKGYAVRNIAIAHAIPEKSEIHCIVNEQMDGTRERLEYLLLLQKKLGKPARDDWGEYCSAALSGTWNQKSLNGWAHFLLSRKLTPQFPNLFSARGTQSKFEVYPWNSIFARFVKEQYGWNAFAELYHSIKTPDNYESAWNAYLNRLEADDPPPPAFAFHPEFQKGMTYAYANGYDCGYATRKSTSSMQQLKQLGVTWIAEIPYGFMPARNAAQIHYAGSDIFGESDESMLAATLQAHTLGMKVMMKPQLWLHFDSWPGKIDFDTDQQWNDWFDSYEKWIVHYAILSELIHADLFCIGTELSQTTLAKPDRWRAIIQKVRNVYHGPIVYASNWGKEFEEMTFWDALDYIGLDNYYPVRKDTKDHTAEMRAAFEQQKAKIKAISDHYHKPVLFTEIGYHATDGAGMGTHEDDYDGYNEHAQAECYQMAMEAYWNEPWFSGMYWWKWFSDPDDTGRNADPHSPHGRAAEKIIQQWYQKPR